MHTIDTAVEFYTQNREKSLCPEIDPNDMKTLIKLCLFSDTTIIGNNAYKQTTGLAMGNNLSPILAIMYMNKVETKIKERINTSVQLWLRYIDDIFIITNLELDEVLRICNTVDEHIKFTLEKPINNKLAYLDVLLTLTNNKFTTELYIKIHT